MKEQLTLGGLIEALEGVRPEAVVVYDFCGFVPGEIKSYRGYYDQLALGYRNDGEDVKAADFLTQLRGAVGKTFTGYKGGEFVMTKGTPLWVSNWGEAWDTAITGVDAASWRAVLVTEFQP